MAKRIFNEIQDVKNNINESYSYDSMDRLTYWSYQGANQSIARDYSYDSHGNLTYKTNAGTMHYDMSKNRLVSRDTAQGQTAQYSYDANGNLLEADGRQYEWTAFNKVSQITDNGNKVGYQYDASRNRVKKTNNGRTTYYFGRDYELVIEAGETGSIRRMRHHIFVGDELVATHEKTLINNQKQVDQTSYMHRDALGSIDTVTDQNQQVIQSNRYTPFGEDIEESGLAKSTRYLNDELRGYTSHENVGLTGLINMNARLYDPLIGRFIQADTMIPEPDSSQSYNRYAYVINNPMKYNDPSGHFWQYVVAAAFTIGVTTDDPSVKQLASVVMMAAMGGDPLSIGTTETMHVMANGATLSFVNGLAMTGDVGEALKTGFNGALTAGITKNVADVIGHGQNPSEYLGQMVLHGVLSELRGGSFKHGAASAFGGKFGTQVSQSLGLGNIGDATGAEVRTAVSMLMGGLTSQASGGDFNHGAVSALMVHLFNDNWKKFDEQIDMNESMSSQGSFFKESRKVGRTLSNRQKQLEILTDEGNLIYRKRSGSYMSGYSEASEELSNLSTKELIDTAKDIDGTTGNNPFFNPAKSDIFDRFRDWWHK